jgi:hypothetical protein
MGVPIKQILLPQIYGDYEIMVNIGSLQLFLTFPVLILAEMKVLICKQNNLYNNSD